MHPLLVGGNPFSTTSIYTLILFLEKKWGIHYSMGGTGSVVKALEKLMNEENIKIIKNAEVTEILIENKKVKGVKINNSEIINCDYIICNSDPPNVYNNLIKSKKDYSFLFKQKMKRMDYSMGGTGNVVKALEKLMKEESIKIIKDAEVTEILTKNKKVTGVKINESKIINCDYVICNSDPPNVYNNLIKSKKDYNFLFKQKMKRMDYSMGLFVYYFGSKKKYNNVAHHTIYFGKSYEKHLDKIFEKKTLSEDISYYLHRPSATDPNMAPSDQDAFYVLVPVPNNLSKINWIDEGDKFKDLVLDKMDKTVLPGIKENVVSDFYLTPDYFEIDLATLHGSGFSIQPKFSQSAYFRFHNQSEIFKNLYFVGAGTHPGAGMPGVLSSAKVLDKLF